MLELRLSVLSLAAALFCFALPCHSEEILGTWELVRADGVRPQDIPPWGFVNLQVEFTEDGVVRHWIPGRESSAREVPYKVVGMVLEGWLGLSNDTATPRPIRFPDQGWLEIDIPDGFVAVFHRVESPSRESRCVFFTVAGDDAIETFAGEARREMYQFQPGSLPGGLEGSWMIRRESENEGNWEIVLTIDDERLSVKRTSLDFDSIPVQEETGLLEVWSSWLRSPVLSCGALHRYRVESSKLVLTADGKNYMELRRVSEAEPGE